MQLPSAVLVPLHHPGGSSGFDWFDVVIGIGVLVLLAAIGYGIWWLIQRRNL